MLRSKHGLTPDQKTHLKARWPQRDLGVEQGLNSLQALSNTQRAHRKEAERFLVWAITHRGKDLSPMSNEGCIEYREFLADPQPRSAWPKVNAGRSFSLAQRGFIEAQLKMLRATSANQWLTFGLHLLYATGLRLSEVVAATVDDLQWVEYPADASDDQPMQGWMLRVIGKGQKEREVPLPIDVVGELAKYLRSRGLDPDPEDIGNQGAFLLG